MRLQPGSEDKKRAGAGGLRPHSSPRGKRPLPITWAGKPVVSGRPGGCSRSVGPPESPWFLHFLPGGASAQSGERSKVGGPRGSHPEVIPPESLNHTGGTHRCSVGLCGALCHWRCRRAVCEVSELHQQEKTRPLAKELTCGRRSAHPNHLPARRVATLSPTTGQAPVF